MRVLERARSGTPAPRGRARVGRRRRPAARASVRAHGAHGRRPSSGRGRRDCAQRVERRRASSASRPATTSSACGVELAGRVGVGDRDEPQPGRVAPTRGPIANPRSPPSATASDRVPGGADAMETPRDTDPATACCRIVWSAPTMAVKQPRSPARSRISSISCVSAPDAIAIGTARGGVADERRGARKQHLAARGELLVALGLVVDQPRDGRVVPAQLRLACA